MSATYRIDVEHQPDPNASSAVQWIGRVVRLSDDEQVTSVWASSAEGAITKAKAYLYEQNVKQTGSSLYVDDEGQDALPLSSVRV
jgi:hypothetical protein